MINRATFRALSLAGVLALGAYAYADDEPGDTAPPPRVLNPVKHYGVTAVGPNTPANVLGQFTQSITWARFTVITQKEGATSPGLGAGFGAGGAGSGAIGDALTGGSGFGGGGGGFGPFQISTPRPSVTTRVVPIPPPTVDLDNFNKVVVLPDETSVQVDVPPTQPGGDGTTVVVNVPPPSRPPGLVRRGRPWPGGGSC